MRKIIYLIVIFAFMTSCIMKKTETATTKTLDINGAGVILKPTIVDLDVNGAKVSGRAVAKFGENIEDVKILLVAEVLRKANADVLVEPRYAFETVNNETTISVSGFPATYKNFRPLKEEDLKLINLGLSQKAEVIEPSPSIKKQ